MREIEGVVIRTMNETVGPRGGLLAAAASTAWAEGDEVVTADHFVGVEAVIAAGGDGHAFF